MIKHGFLKCGISNNLDGSEDHHLNINGLEGYEFPNQVSEFQMNDDNTDTDTDTDTDSDDYLIG